VTKPSNPLTLHKRNTVAIPHCLTSTLEPDFGSYLSDDSEEESVYADSELGEAGQATTIKHKRAAKRSLGSIGSWQGGGGGASLACPTFRAGQDISCKGSASPSQPAKKHRRRLSDGGKARSKKAIPRPTVSASCSPALTRKALDPITRKALDPNTRKMSDPPPSSPPDQDAAISTLSNKVSDDINQMVEQIQAIQHDISELAGRPISLVGGPKG